MRKDFHGKNAEKEMLCKAFHVEMTFVNLKAGNLFTRPSVYLEKRITAQDT